MIWENNKMKNVSRFGVLLLLAGLFILAATPAAAQDLNDLKQQLKALEAKIAELEKKTEKQDFSVSWKGGTTKIKTKNAELKISNRLQVRWTDSNPGNETKETVGSFRIRRMKTAFKGWVYNKRLTYKLQCNWASSKYLEDAYVDYDLTGNKMLRIRAGQYKAPFGRQELTSSGKQQFVDRSIVSGEFADGRDIGLMFHGRFGTDDVKDMFEWAVGWFNGNGVMQKTNDNTKYQFDARLMFSPWGSAGYSESNFKYFDEPRLSLGINFEHDDRRLVDVKGGDYYAGMKHETLGYDLAFKWKILSLYAEYFDRTNTDRDILSSQYDDDGFAAQIGVFAIPKKLEFVARTATFDPDQDFVNDNHKETGFGVNWFWNKHKHKIQADYRQIKYESPLPDGSLTDKEIRVQYQIIF